MNRGIGTTHNHTALWILVLALLSMLLMEASMLQAWQNWIGLIGGIAGLFSLIAIIVGWALHHHRERNLWNMRFGTEASSQLTLFVSDTEQQVIIYLTALDPIDPLMRAIVYYDASEGTMDKLLGKILAPRLKATLQDLPKGHIQQYSKSIKPKTSLWSLRLLYRTMKEDTTGKKPQIKSAIYEDSLGHQRNIQCSNGVCIVNWEPEGNSSYPTVSKRAGIKITLSVLATAEWKGALDFQSDVNHILQDTIRTAVVKPTPSTSHNKG